MIEALVFIAGIVILWKGGSAITAFLQGFGSKAQGVSEDIIASATLERQRRHKQFLADCKKEGYKPETLVSHEDMRKLFRID